MELEIVKGDPPERNGRTEVMKAGLNIGNMAKKESRTNMEGEIYGDAAPGNSED